MGVGPIDADAARRRGTLRMGGLVLGCSLVLIRCGNEPSEPAPAADVADSDSADSDQDPTDGSAPVDEPEGGWTFVAHDTIDFKHQRFMTEGRKYLPETAGSGVALLDADGDGRLDVYAVQCAPLPGHPNPPSTIPPNQLFRNVGSLRFEDVTSAAGVGDTGYGMGATAPDLDGDGFPELYVTNVFDNVLYHNAGDGTFRDVTEASGMVEPGWSAATGWADLDRDGDLDPYVANYGVVDFDNFKPCSELIGDERLISYCHPDSLTATPDHVYRNDGGLRFVNVTEGSGIVDTTGKGLAVVPFDHDDDGWTDLYVANDSNENFLWRNRQDWTFEDIAPDVSVDVSYDGKSQACMGSDIGDVDRDGDFDLFSANFGKEPNVLYVRGDDEWYDDRIKRAGMGEASYLMTGFGSEFFDVDLDGDLDLMVVNGHIVDLVEQIDSSQTFLQPAHLFVNRGDGVFDEVGKKHSAYFHEMHLGRGLAVGDLDNDGDLDAVLNNNDEAMVVLENRTVGRGHHWIGLRLVGGNGSPRDPIGARVTVTCGDQVQVEELRGSSSYLSWADLRLHFGLGSHDASCQVTVRWPNGQTTTHQDLTPDQYHTVEEPK